MKADRAAARVALGPSPSVCGVGLPSSRADSAGRHLQAGPDMHRDLGGIIIHEMSDSVVRDAPQPGPFPQRPDRGLPPSGENPAGAEPSNVGQGTGAGRKIERRLHANRRRVNRRRSAS
jgi:hypothetical protein